MADRRSRPVDGQRVWGLGNARRVLYRLPELTAADHADPVFVVEGEKDADRLASEGLIATTAPMGAGKWSSDYTGALKGRRVVVLIDNATAGRKHGVTVAKALTSVARDVRVVVLPGLRDGEDVSDWLDRDHSAEDLLKEIMWWRPLDPVRVEQGDSQVPDRGEPWSEPIQPRRDDVPSFPIAEAFPSHLHQAGAFLTAVAEETQTPVDVAAMLMLPIAGLAMSKKYVVSGQPGNQRWLETPNLFTVSLLEPGNRKSAVYRILRAPLDNWRHVQEEASRSKHSAHRLSVQMLERRLKVLVDIASGSRRSKSDETDGKGAGAEADQVRSQLDELKRQEPHPPCPYTSEPTSEALAQLLSQNKERLAVLSDEGEAIDVFMGRYSDGKPNFQIYNKAWDGSAHRVDRRSAEPISLDSPLLSVEFTVQPEAVRGMLTNRKADGTGLVARSSWSDRRAFSGIAVLSLPLSQPSSWRGTRGRSRLCSTSRSLTRRPSLSSHLRHTSSSSSSDPTSNPSFMRTARWSGSAAGRPSSQVKSSASH